MSENNAEKKITGPEAVRVRFAPSPTGYLHIGSARTAFFNWLYAKKTKGRFILRIEDTDFSRHMEESVYLMMDSLKWLGITWDEGPDIGGNYGPYRQSQRQDIYREFAKNLISEGKAYYCFCTQEKLKEKRGYNSNLRSGGDEYSDAGIVEKSYKYDRECLKLSGKQIEKNLDKGVPYAIRLLIPENTEITFTDVVYGKIQINSNVLEDFIILRSNGLPTYNFSVAVDDILMEITHVIRGEDHLSNTPKQVLIYNSLSKNLPNFIHLPMILGQDGQKLSKRHGSISIESYKQEGFLPEAINNYLALLGWSYDEKTTIFSTHNLINKFSLEKINKKPSKFDYDKLLWLNGYYIRIAKNDLFEKLLQEKFMTEVQDAERFIKNIPKIIPLIKPRIKTLNEAGRFILPFFNEVNYKLGDAAGIKDDIKDDIDILDASMVELDSLEKFSAEKIEASLKMLSDKLNINFKKITEVIRIAAWGSKVSPPLYETLSLLGKPESIKRLKKYKVFLINSYKRN